MYAQFLRILGFAFTLLAAYFAIKGETAFAAADLAAAAYLIARSVELKQRSPQEK